MRKKSNKELLYIHISNLQKYGKYKLCKATTEYLSNLFYPKISTRQIYRYLKELKAENRISVNTSSAYITVRGFTKSRIITAKSSTIINDTNKIANICSNKYLNVNEKGKHVKEYLNNISTNYSNVATTEEYEDKLIENISVRQWAIKEVKKQEIEEVESKVYTKEDLGNVDKVKDLTENQVIYLLKKLYPEEEEAVEATNTSSYPEWLEERMKEDFPEKTQSELEVEEYRRTHAEEIEAEIRRLDEEDQRKRYEYEKMMWLKARYGDDWKDYQQVFEDYMKAD